MHTGSPQDEHGHPAGAEAGPHLGAVEDIVLLVFTQHGPGLDGGSIAPTMHTEQ